MDLKISFLIALACVALLVKLLDWVWFRPKKLEKMLRKQGINGNSYKLFLGDMKDFIQVMKTEQPKTINLSDNIIPHVLPYYHQIIKEYGKNSFVWFGTTPRLNISDPELIKEILMKPGVFHKPGPDIVGETIVGGLLFLEDDRWAKHRKIVNTAFHLHKLKSMVPAMFLSCSNMVEKWEALFPSSQSSLEVNVCPYLESLSGDVIARTAFGLNYEEGRTIFEIQKEQVKLVWILLRNYFIPGWRYLPTKENRKMKANSKAVKIMIKGMIKQRQKAMARGERISDDLLGILVESMYNETQQNGKQKAGLSVDDVIEECKLFYFAGSETTSDLMVWAMVLLSIHREWQARAREEVLLVFGKSDPTFDGLSHLKVVTMILQEVLRMYPPGPMLLRAPTKTVKLGNMVIPKGTELTLLVGLVQYDPKIWGNDAKEFKPHRFCEGISHATKTQFSFLPFSAGPRACLGQNFAMMEVKMALVMILQRFSFELSASYLHAPFQMITMQPQHGVPLVLHKL